MIDTREKIVAADQIPATDASTVVAIGHFDVIRSQHGQLLKQARSACERLIAFVLADIAGKPSLLDHQARANLTAALAPVDYVVIGTAVEAKALAERLDASVTLDIDGQLQRDTIADVLQRQSAGK